MGSILSQEEAGYARGDMKPRVEFDNRPLQMFPDCVFAVLFVIAVAAHLIGGFVMVGSVNVSLTLGDDPSGGLSNSLVEDLNACQNSVAGRRLQLDVQNEGFFSLFSRAPEIPIVIILLVPIIAGIWIFLLTKFSRPIVWLTVALSIAVWFAFGITLQATVEGSAEVSYIFFALGAIYIIATFIVKEKIKKAAEHLEMASVALTQIPHVFFAAAVPEMLLVGYLALHWWFMIQSQLIAEVVNMGSYCALQVPSWVAQYTVFMTFAMLWVLVFMHSVQLHITAMSVGHWYFNAVEDKDRTKVGFTALKLAFSKSTGTLAISSILSTIAEFIISQVNTTFWWTNPLNCILKCFLMCMNGLIMSLTRYCIIGHSITGLEFTGSVKAALGVLKRNFVGGYVNNRIGTLVMNSATYSISLTLGFATWAWIDSTTGTPTLSEMVSLQGDNSLIFIALCMLYLYLLKYPVASLFVCILLSSFLSGFGGELMIYVNTVLAASFVAAVCRIIIGFQCKVILNGLDTIFFCYAIGNEAELPVAHAEFSNMYVLLQDDEQMVKKGVSPPVAEAVYATSV